MTTNKQSSRLTRKKQVLAKYPPIHTYVADSDQDIRVDYFAYLLFLDCKTERLEGLAFPLILLWDAAEKSLVEVEYFLPNPDGDPGREMGDYKYELPYRIASHLESRGLVGDGGNYTSVWSYHLNASTAKRWKAIFRSYGFSLDPDPSGAPELIYRHMREIASSYGTKFAGLARSAPKDPTTASILQLDFRPFLRYNRVPVEYIPFEFGVTTGHLFHPSDEEVAARDLGEQEVKEEEASLFTGDAPFPPSAEFDSTSTPLDRGGGCIKSSLLRIEGNQRKISYQLERTAGAIKGDTEQIIEILTPVSKVRPQRKPLRKAFRPNDLVKILKASRPAGVPWSSWSQFRVAVFLMAVTGMRVSECYPLRVGDVRHLFKDQCLTVYRPKTKDYHTYFVSARGLSNRFLIERDLRLLGEGDGYLFKSAYRKSLTRLINSNLSRLEGHGFPAYRTHSFRIGRITSWLAADIPIQQVRRLIGHKNIQTTSLYDRWDPANREAAEKMALSDVVLGAGGD